MREHNATWKEHDLTQRRNVAKVFSCCSLRALRLGVKILEAAYTNMISTCYQQE